jgi:amidophosphoribosyltransferase
MIDGDVGEECGIVGVWAPGAGVAGLLADGLLALQHRGQESAGFSVGDYDRIATHRGMGLVADVLRDGVVQRFRGHAGIAHVRYSTSGKSSVDNAQPVPVTSADGTDIVLAHNGNLTEVPAPVVVGGGVAHAAPSSDTRALVALLGREPGSLGDAMAAVLPRVRGAYSLVCVAAGRLFAARDPHGFRPLSLGRLGGEGWAVASETVALEAIGATVLREIEPAEIVEIGPHGVHTRRSGPVSRALCSFEHVYFARPDSVIDGASVYEVRKGLGIELARHAPVDADLVVPVPDTGRVSALGFAEESGIAYGEGLYRNPYANRSFIEPSQRRRTQAVRRKLSPVRSVVRGRRLVVVDDSIVRANSVTQVVALLRDAGAREIHLRIASPPVRWPCFFGVDFGSARELIADRLSPDQLARHVGADSLDHLPVAALVARASGRSGGLCTGCFTGTYPPDR